MAIWTRLYRLMFGAIELYLHLQKGHILFFFAHWSMHALQKVCPQGNKMYGWLFGGRKRSKQMGHVFDIT